MSYLPDLQAYLHDLLRNRERVLAATEVDDWARTEALPSEEEIRRIRRLIGQVRPTSASSPPSDRAQTDQAVAAVRRHRVTMLGMPRIRQPPSTFARSTPHEPAATPATRHGRRAPRRLCPLPPARHQGPQRRRRQRRRDQRPRHAGEAGVDRSFFYRHRDLHAQVMAKAQPPASPAAGPAVSRASLIADLLAAHERAARLTPHNRQLQQRLSELLGEQAWQESGLGAPADIDALHQKITHLEQQVIDLRLQLEERDQDLDAARAANRELITQINAPGSNAARHAARHACTTPVALATFTQSACELQKRGNSRPGTSQDPQRTGRIGRCSRTRPLDAYIRPR